MTSSNPQPGGSYRMAATTTGNGFALASLLCSILLFCVPFVGSGLGIVFGILGMKRAKVSNDGNGVAIAGLIIGIVGLIYSVIFLSAGGATYFFAKKAIASSSPARAIARQYVIDLNKGDVDAALSNTSGLPREYVATQSAILKPMGTFQDMTSNDFNVDSSGWTFSGTAAFANGTKSYTIKLTGSGSSWKVYSALFE